MEQHLVEGGKGGGRQRLADRGGPDGVAGQRGDQSGLHAFAAHIAYDQAPVVRADLEDVVEVAPDLRAVTRGAVSGAKLETGDLRVSRRNEGLLQRAGERHGADFGFLGSLLGPQEFSFVLPALGGVEHGSADRRRRPVGISLKDRVNQHWQAKPVGTDQVEGDLTSGAVHLQQGGVVRLVGVRPPGVSRSTSRRCPTRSARWYPVSVRKVWLTLAISPSGVVVR